MDNKDDYTLGELEKLLEDDGYVGRFQEHPETPVTPPDEIPAEEAPVTPIEEAPAEEIPAAPVEEVPAEEIPAAPVPPIEDVPVEKVPAEEIPATPLENTPAEEIPVTPLDDAPAEEIPVTPLEEAPAEEIPVTPLEEVPAEEIPVTPLEDTPEAPAVPFEDAPAAPVEEMPAEEAGELPAAPPAEEADPELDEISRILSDSPDQTPEPPAEAPELPAEPENPVEQEFRNAADGEEFDEMFHAEPEAPKAPAHKRPARKGRPKRKKGEGFFGIPNILATLVWLAITVLIGVTLGRMIWICAADVLAFGREDKPVTITIYETDTIDDITQKLYEGDLIRYPGLFKFYASLAVDEGEIHPGIWDLNTRYDYHALVNMMSPSSSRDVIKVMIPEGYSSRQIFALLEEKKICTAKDLGAYAASGELEDYWFLEDVERGEANCLDGFLFPDTYQFYKNDSPENVLNKLLGNFNNRFDETMQEQIASLNAHLTDLMHRGGKSEDFINSHQFTIHDVVIVASMIEKETSSAEEGYTIASVIYNRLFNWGDNPAYLNIDASIVYALDGKTDLTVDDLKIDSPYNTYTHTGLTPGAISNPGLASLKAALDPQDTDYYYYVLDPATGAHRFTTTYDEHQAAIASIGGNE